MADENDRSRATASPEQSTTAAVEENLTPAAALELAAHETRVAIIETLRAADGGPLSFGDIRERIDIDDPGQCHYHVNKLCDRFVRKTDDGYQLSPAGWRLIGALLSGAVTASLPEQTVSTDGSCGTCGGDLQAHLRKSGVTVVCVECKLAQTDPDIPPAILEDWPYEEIPAVVGRYLRRNEIAAAHGFCPNCDGRVDRTVATPGEEAAPDWFEEAHAEAVVVTTCRRCGKWWHGFPSIPALAYPAAVALFEQHGIDLRERPWWTLDQIDIGGAAVTADPRRVRVPLSLGDGWTLVFDGDFEFVEKRC